MSTLDHEPFVVDKNLGEKLQFDPNEMPRSNSDGDPVVELTQEQKYLFDARGWLLVPGVLSESQVEEMRCHAERVRDERRTLGGRVARERRAAAGVARHERAHAELDEAEPLGDRGHLAVADSRAVGARVPPLPIRKVDARHLLVDRDEMRIFERRFERDERVLEIAANDSHHVCDV